MLFAEGANFRIVIDRGCAQFRLWRRGDLDSKQGARLAEETVSHFEALAELPEKDARALVMDIREGPIVCGPMTQLAVGRMLKAWGKTSRPLGVLCGDAPIQSLQYKRLISQNASRSGRVFVSPRELSRWLLELGIIEEELSWQK